MRFYADHTQVHASNPPAEKKTCWLKPPMLQKWANYPSESRLKRPRHTRMKSWQRFHTRLSRKGPLRQPAMIWSPSPPGAPPCRFGWEPLSRQGAAPPWQQPWASGPGSESMEQGKGHHLFGKLGFWCLWNVFMVHALRSENVACDGSMMSNGGSELCRA